MSRRYASPPDLEFEAMSQVVRTGDTVWVSGLAAYRDGEVIGIGDSLAQARQILVNLDRCLSTVGGSLAAVVRLTCFVTDEAHFAGYRQAKHEAFAGRPFPAATTVVVAGLLVPEFLMEVEAIAVIDGR
jgi:enamine deaminase RidA (YjgF/YER057c/UK114 family)